MRFRQVFAAFVCSLALAVGQAPWASAVSTPPDQCSQADLQGDPRLGPQELPTQGSVGVELRGYDRLAGLTPEQFIATYWDATANGGAGGWRFPPANGFLIGPDGEPIDDPTPLRVGQRLDRYGSEFGAFLAPAGARYSQRALPPQSLDNAASPGACNYSLYRVARAFTVNGGPIAPGFGQPGMGLQYLLVGALVPGAPERLNVRWLIDNGFLQRCVPVPSRPFAC